MSESLISVSIALTWLFAMLIGCSAERILIRDSAVERAALSQLLAAPPAEACW